MDIYISERAAAEAAKFIADNFPGRPVLLFAPEGSENEFLRQGLKILPPGSDAEDKAVAAGVGSAENYRSARLSNAWDYILTGGADFSEMVSNFSIIGYRKIKTRYPKAIFIESGDENLLLEESALFSARSYLSILDYGLRNGFVGEEERRRVQTAWELVKEGGAKERIDFFAKTLSEGYVRSEFEALAASLSGKSGLPFVAVALFTAIRFTNFDFSSILLGRDEAAARSLTGEGTFGSPAAKKRTPNLFLARKYLPSASEISEWCSGAFVSADADAETELSVYAAAAALSRGNGFFASLWDVGFVDGMLRGAEHNRIKAESR